MASRVTTKPVCIPFHLALTVQLVICVLHIPRRATTKVGILERVWKES